MNAALRAHGTTYSKFLGAMKVKKMALNTKMLALFAHERPETFARILASVK